MGINKIMTKLKDKQFKTKGALIPFLRRLFTYSKKYPKWVKGFIACVLVVSVLEAIYPLIWLRLIDNVIVPGINGSAVYSELDKYGMFYIAYAAVFALSVFGFIILAGKIQEFVMYDIRQALFTKFQELSFSFFDRSAVGWLLSRIASDSNKVTELISWGMIGAIWGIGMIVLCVTAMFIYNWKLALIVTLTIPVLGIVSVKIRMLILKYSRESRRYNSEITASFNEHINGVEVNKSLVQESRVSAEFRRLSDRMRIASFKSEFFGAVYMPLIIFGGSIAAALVLYYGGRMAITIPSEITVGTLAAFFGYATLMYEPILDISRFYSNAQNSISAGERIFSLLDTKPAIMDKTGAGNYGNLKGDIEFRNVSFYYEEGKTVLRNMNLKIDAGTSVALVGETGGGKSTIVSLICRFYEPESGNIFIDGTDYTLKTMNSLRSQFGIVLQTPHLFSGTIRENIKYGRQEASEEDVKKALTLSGADEFIARLDEQAGENGDNLSEGEKQLVSFARAVLADPRIFIMDEATSSVDTLTEVKIQSGIKQIIKERTSIIIAHRLSTIKNCDRILYIHRGKIIEDGSHRELLKKRGEYYRLYARQLLEEREKELLTV